MASLHPCDLLSDQYFIINGMGNVCQIILIFNQNASGHDGKKEGIKVESTEQRKKSGLCSADAVFLVTDGDSEEGYHCNHCNDVTKVGDEKNR